MVLLSAVVRCLLFNRALIDWRYEGGAFKCRPGTFIKGREDKNETIWQDMGMYDRT